MGKTKASEKPSKPQAKWTESHTRTLLDSLQEQTKDINTSDNNFSAPVWTKATSELNTSYGLDLNQSQVKNHYTTLKKNHNLMCELKEASGLGWEDAKQTVTAPESFWPDWVASHPGFKVFKNHGFPYFEEMDALLGNTPISGAHRTGTSTQPKRQQAPSLSAEERCLDKSESEHGDKEPPRQIIRSGSQESSLPDLNYLFNDNPPPLTKEKMEAKNSISQVGPPPRDLTITTPSTSQNPFTSKSTIPKPIDKPSSKPSGLKAPVNLASSLKLVSEALVIKAQAAVRRDEIKEGRSQTRAQAIIEAARIKNRAFPLQDEAMLVFTKGNEDHLISIEDRIAAADILRSEHKAAFFVQLSDDLRWNWLKEKINKSN